MLELRMLEVDCRLATYRLLVNDRGLALLALSARRLHGGLLPGGLSGGHFVADCCGCMYGRRCVAGMGTWPREKLVMLLQEKSREVGWSLTAAKCHDNKPLTWAFVGALPDTHLARAQLLVGWGSEAGRSGVQLFTLSSAALPERAWWLRTPHRTAVPTLQAACPRGTSPRSLFSHGGFLCVTLRWTLCLGMAPANPPSLVHC